MPPADPCSAVSQIIVAVSLLEEPDLVRAIGGDYEDYQARVPMYCPFFGGANKEKGE